MTDRDELAALREQIDRLQQELDDLRTERTGHVPERTPADTPVQDAVGRRRWLQAAAGTAVGLTAAAVASRPVAADPDDLSLGVTNTTAARTQADYTGGLGGSAFLFQSGTGLGGFNSAYPSALAGWTTVSNQPTGVYGYTAVNDEDANGVVGAAASSAPEAVGVRGRHFGFGTGVRGEAPSGFGVVGSGRTGVVADGSQYGLNASGETAALFLPPAPDTAPPDRSDAHDAGEIDVHRLDAVGFESDLWYCAGGGTPGRWRKLAGVGTAGSLHPVEPTRVYDSRNGDGPLGSGGSRVVDAADGIDVTSGAVSVVDLVPEGATAIAFNLTIVATTGGGFLSVAPGDATELGASTINWTGSGQALANGSLVKLDDDRRIRVFAGPSGSTQFIVDVTGFYL